MKELSDETRELIELARSVDEPDAQAVSRVEPGLSRRLALGAGIVGGGAAVAKSATGAGLVATGAKSAAAMLVVGAVAMTGYELSSAPDEPQARTRETQEQMSRPSSKSGATSERRAARTLPPRERQEGTVASQVTTREETAPSRTPAAPARPRVETSPVPSEPLAPEMREDGLMAETAALKVAQRAMRGGDPGTALRLLGEQDIRYRGGALHQERSAARVLALCQAGRVGEARALARDFQQRWPRSPLSGRVAGACAER